MSSTVCGEKGNCCFEYELPESVLSKIGTQEVYSQATDYTDNDHMLDDLLFLLVDTFIGILLICILT
jgi:hypothetical protein